MWPLGQDDPANYNIETNEFPKFYSLAVTWSVNEGRAIWFMWLASHVRISMVIADGLVPI